MDNETELRLKLLRLARGPVPALKNRTIETYETIVGEYRAAEANWIAEALPLIKELAREGTRRGRHERS